MALSPNLARNNRMCHTKLTLTLIFLLVVGIKLRIKEVKYRSPDGTVISEADSVPDTHEIFSSLRGLRILFSVHTYALLDLKSHGWY
jgi:hypothetical protein